MNTPHEASLENGRTRVLLSHDLSPALTVMKGQIHLLRRRLERGDEVAHLETDLETIEAELARLQTTGERLHQRRPQ